MRILLVEDDGLVADAIVRGLSQAGFTVDHAGSAELARIVLRTEHFDLAVVDIGLPAADGFTLLQSLRSEGKATPVLILTARYTLGDKIRAFDLGADDFRRSHSSKPSWPRAAGRSSAGPVTHPAARCAWGACRSIS